MHRSKRQLPSWKFWIAVTLVAAVSVFNRLDGDISREVAEFSGAWVGAALLALLIRAIYLKRQRP